MKDHTSSIDKNRSGVQGKAKGAVLKNVALAFTSLLLFLLLAEGVLSMFGYGNLIIYKPDQILFWKPVPVQERYTKIGHKPVLINSHGTRGREFNAEKPENTLRIISLGDSRTFGWGLSEDETYSGLLEGHIREYLGDSGEVEVINAGVNGWSYSQLMLYLKEVALKYDPDIVIVGEANLWTQFSESSSEEFIKDMMVRVWLKNILRRSAVYHYVVEVKLKRFYDKYKKNFIPVDPETDTNFEQEKADNPDAYFKSQIAGIVNMLTTHGIKGVLLFIPFDKEDLTLSKFNNTLLRMKRELSREMDVPFVDVSDAFLQSRETLYFEGDAVHPNAEGNRILAYEIFEVLKKEKIAGSFHEQSD